MNPKIQYCQCGYEWEPKLYHKMVMLVFGRYVWTCPHCQARVTFQLIGHVVKVDMVKVLNEDIWKR